MNFKYTRILNWVTWAMVIFAISSNLYTIFHVKAFWLDEWFILHNIKTKSYLEIIGQLDYIQQFPRIYLILIKYLAESSNYNYYVIRLMPTVAQLFNILFVLFSISSILFKESGLKKNLFILFFLSFQITIFYFTQLKQYTMEMSVALIGLWFFDFLCRDIFRKSFFSKGYVAFLFYLFFAPFFSYTFIFVNAPIIIILFFTLIDKQNTQINKVKILIPLLLFVISICLNYLTDLRYVLTSKNQYVAFSENIFNWQSVSSISGGVLNLYKLPGYLFLYTPSEFNRLTAVFLSLVKFSIIALTIYGAFNIWKHLIKNLSMQSNNLVSFLSLKRDMNISIYLFLSLIVMVVFYLSGKLPIGQARLNYFSIIFLLFFLLEGSQSLARQLPFFNKFILGILLFASIYQGLRGYYREYQNRNLLFDQKIYDTIGSALSIAGLKNLTICVKDNEFYPSSIIEHAEKLAIETHPSFSLNKSSKVAVFYGAMPSKLDIMSIDSAYILLKKHSYTIEKIYKTSND